MCCEAAATASNRRAGADRSGWRLASWTRAQGEATHTTPHCSTHTTTTAAAAHNRPQQHTLLKPPQVQARAAPFNDYNPSDSVDDLSLKNRSSRRSSSSNSSRDADDTSLPEPEAASSANNTPPPPQRQPQQQQASTTPRPLMPAAAQQLEQLLLELLPKPPASTPATPVLALTLPILQSNLSALPPRALLGVLRLCNAVGSGGGHNTPSAAWLQDWAAALHKQLPKLSAQTSCSMLAEVLRLRQAQLPEGLLDDLFTGVLKDPSSCSGSSLAEALVAVAAAELAHINGSSSSTSASSTASAADNSSSSNGDGNAVSSSSRATPNVTLASWRSGYYSSRGGSSGRSGPDVAAVSQLSPLALHGCVEELGQGDRMARLQPVQLAGLAAAVAALQLRLPAGWLDRCVAECGCTLVSPLSLGIEVVTAQAEVLEKESLAGSTVCVYHNVCLVLPCVCPDATTTKPQAV